MMLPMFFSELTDKLEGLNEEVEILKVHNDTLKSQHERLNTEILFLILLKIFELSINFGIFQ